MQKRSEHTEQCQVIGWAKALEGRYPELALLHATPNAGKRSLTVAAMFKAEGLKAGVPDLCLPIPRKGYGSLWLEMKYGKNGLTEAQEWWLRALALAGNATFVCYSADEAIGRIKRYLDIE